MVGMVELETMPLNTSWSKFQEQIMIAMASSFLYGLALQPGTIGLDPLVHRPQYPLGLYIFKMLTIYQERYYFFYILN
jgi:hypothetical protein